MEKLEHPLWIVDFVNAVLGPPVHAAGEALGYHFSGHHVIPNYIVMVMLIVAFVTVLSLLVRSRLSVENPGKFQILLEDGVRAVRGLLVEWIGPTGPRFMPLVATLGLFILMGNFVTRAGTNRASLEARLTWRQKMQITGRAWRRWGWREARGAVERETTLLRELSRERSIGFQLIKGVKWPHKTSAP